MSNKRTILFVTTLSSFLTPFMGSAINIALPEIGKEMNMNTIQLGWVATSYLLAAAVFLLPFGRLADRNGRKKLFMYGIILFGVASGLSALAFNWWILILSRTLNGIGGAMIYATALAILTSAFPKNERGKALGINVASVYLGLSLGPTLGGFLTMYLGWRSIFAFTAILSVIILVFAGQKLADDKKPLSTIPFDTNGSLIYGISLALFIYGFPLLPSLSGILIVTTGLIGFVLFGKQENKAKEPLLDMNIFRKNHVFLFSNFAAFINYSATYALVFLLSFYLQQIKHMSPAEAGMILMSQPVMMTLFSPLAGILSDRIEPAIVASIGMGITVAGLIAFAFITATTGIWIIVLLLMFLGLGFALFSSPNTNAVMSSVSPPQYGIASATLGTMRLTGQTMSMGISMLIMAVIIGKSVQGAVYTAGLLKSIHLTFLVFSILCLAGTFFSMKRGSLRSS